MIGEGEFVIPILLGFFGVLLAGCFYKRRDIARAMKNSHARRYPHNRY